MQDQATPTAPAEAPAAGPTAAQPGATAPTVNVPGAPDPSAVLRGAEARRDELRDQLERVEDQRNEIAGQLRRGEERGDMNDGVRQGLESRLAALDGRIVALDAEIATADAAVAQAAAVPGAVIEVPPTIIHRSGPDEDVVAIVSVFGTILLLPFVIAYARRIWRRSAVAVTALPAELMQRLTRMEQGMDAMAIEVERISEGQRFMTRIFTESTERKALGEAQEVGRKV